MSSSRKRSSHQSKTALCGDHPVNNGSTYEYYRPGCYCTPQVVVGEPTPYNCSYLHQYPVQWLCCNAATYVGDTYGMVYYLSDFEHQLQLSNGITLDAKATYPYYYDKGEYDDMDDEADVSPRKRERFEELDCDTDSREPVPQNPFIKNKNPNTALEEGPNIYRSPQGYLVEEPAD